MTTASRYTVHPSKAAGVFHNPNGISPSEYRPDGVMKAAICKHFLPVTPQKVELAYKFCCAHLTDTILHTRVVIGWESDVIYFAKICAGSKGLVWLAQ